MSDANFQERLARLERRSAAMAAAPPEQKEIVPKLDRKSGPSGLFITMIFFGSFALLAAIGAVIFFVGQFSWVQDMGLDGIAIFAFLGAAMCAGFAYMDAKFASK